MALQKQLWLAMAGLMTLTFCTTFLATTWSARDYLQHQLLLKNVDNASVLAHSLDRLGDDPQAKRNLLEAQFSGGNYQLIELRDASNNTLESFRKQHSNQVAPAWFRELINLDIAPGVAQLSADGEVLTVRSQVAFAYDSMWRNGQWLAAIFAIAALVGGALCSLIIKLILKPLRAVMDQARAIGERRFVSTELPRSHELGALVQSMNELSGRVKAMLNQEAKRMEKWRQDAHVDEVTGILNRDHFIKLLDSTLQADDANASGVITLIRISELANLNQVHGREAVDSILSGFGMALSSLRMQNRAIAAGRLNGADFALLSPRELDATAVGRDLQRALREVLQERGLGDEVLLPGASTLYIQGDSTGDLLTNLDSALLNAEKQGESDMIIMGRDGIQMMPVRQELGRWRSMLHHAFSEKKFALATFPVVNINGGELHREAPARLNWRDNTLTAGQFLPWIHRLELGIELDRQVVELALDELDRNPRPLAINLSGSALSDSGFLPWLSQMLSTRSDAATLLWIEVQEATAYRHLEAFKRLCTRCKRYNTRVGIEHLGHQLSDIGRLHDVGVDYVKVDSAFLRGIHDNPANQTLLRTLATLVHSLGITVIAEGISSEAEWNALADLGIDAATGPWVTTGTEQAAPSASEGLVAYR